MRCTISRIKIAQKSESLRGFAVLADGMAPSIPACILLTTNYGRATQKSPIHSKC